MKKRFDWLVIVVNGMTVFGILAGAFSAYKYFIIGKTEKRQEAAAVTLPDLERVESNLWNNELIYTDRRGQYTLHFVDPDKDGQVDRVGSSLRNHDKENEVSETPLMTFYIAETYYNAEDTNRRILRGKDLNGQFCLARDSSEAEELQELYNSALAEYRKLHPELKLPENADPSTRIRPKTIERFTLLQ